MSRPFAIQVSEPTFEEIRDKLIEAGYDTLDDGVISLHGIGIACSGDPVTLKHLAAVELHPGDTLVFTASDRLSARVCEQIHKIVTETLPGHKVLVLDAGMELGILREPPPPSSEIPLATLDWRDKMGGGPAE